VGQKQITGVPGTILILFTIILFLITSCRPPGFIFTEDGKIECGADGKAIILTNNATAADPTFDELMAFILADTTDTLEYIVSGPGAFVCADFAEAVHNNAEAAGIRAAWVGLSFEGLKEGHALNAFETSDKGLVYIDCTNSGGIKREGEKSRSRDTIAYIEPGKKYGVLTIERVLAAKFEYYSFEYTFYTDCEEEWREYEAQLKAFNEEVTRYNRESVSQVLVFGSPEAQKMLLWKQQLLAAQRTLENMQEKTGGRWLESEYSSYPVKSVNIHW
jgi:hypothetical protein